MPGATQPAFANHRAQRPAAVRRVPDPVVGARRFGSPHRIVRARPFERMPDID
jgi:hypothetical protein